MPGRLKGNLAVRLHGEPQGGAVEIILRFQTLLGIEVSPLRGVDSLAELRQVHGLLVDSLGKRSFDGLLLELDGATQFANLCGYIVGFAGALDILHEAGLLVHVFNPLSDESAMLVRSDGYIARSGKLLGALGEQGKSADGGENQILFHAGLVYATATMLSSLKYHFSFR